MLLRYSYGGVIPVVRTEVVLLEQFVNAGTSRAAEYVIASRNRGVSTHVTAMGTVDIATD